MITLGQIITMPILLKRFLMESCIFPKDVLLKIQLYNSTQVLKNMLGIKFLKNIGKDRVLSRIRGIYKLRKRRYLGQGPMNLAIDSVILEVLSESMERNRSLKSHQLNLGPIIIDQKST